ncbi:MAG: PEP-CTERM sorting domain-containing protein [Akkermansia sp.]
MSAALTWEEGYKVVAGVRGGWRRTSAYTITGIQVSYETVPEPAAASLGLLGLGAMLLRRRRSVNILVIWEAAEKLPFFIFGTGICLCFWGSCERRDS